MNCCNVSGIAGLNRKLTASVPPAPSTHFCPNSSPTGTLLLCGFFTTTLPVKLQQPPVFFFCSEAHSGWIRQALKTFNRSALPWLLPALVTRLEGATRKPFNSCYFRPQKKEAHLHNSQLFQLQATERSAPRKLSRRRWTEQSCVQPFSCARWAPVQSEEHFHRPAAVPRDGRARSGAHRSFPGTQMPLSPAQPVPGPSVTLRQQLLGGDLVPPDCEHPAQGGRAARSSGSAARSAAAPLGLGHAGELLHGERGPVAAGDGELPASHASAPRPLPAASARRGEEEKEEGREEGGGAPEPRERTSTAPHRAARGGSASGGGSGGALRRIAQAQARLSQAGTRPEVTFWASGGAWSAGEVRSRVWCGRLSVRPPSASLRAALCFP